MSEVSNLVSKEAVDKLKDLATHADICMFATSLTKLPLTARPMSTVAVDEEGCIWFLSQKSSEKNQEIKADNRVQLFYASKGSAEYLNVYGEAEIIINREKAEEIWTPIAKAWFPGGVDDPEVSIIKVTPLDCHYWDTKHGKLVSLFKIAAAMISGKPMDDGIEGDLNV